MLPLIATAARAMGVIGRAGATAGRAAGRIAYHKRNRVNDDGSIRTTRDRFGRYIPETESVIFGIDSAKRAKIKSASQTVGRYAGKKGMQAGKSLGRSGGKFGLNVFAAVGDMVMLEKPQWQRDETAIAKKQAKAYMKRNPNLGVSEEELIESIKFDNAYGTDFTAKQYGGKTKSRFTRKNLLEYNPRGASGFADGVSGGGTGGFSTSVGGGLGGNGSSGKGGMPALAGSGGIAKVALINSEGVSSIVSANKETKGAVESSGSMIVNGLSGTSKLLQGEGGRFKEGNPGGKSLVVAEIKKAQETLEVVTKNTQHLSTAIQTGDAQELTQLKRIGNNTSPEMQGGGQEVIAMTINEGHQLAKVNNVLTETSNKYLAFIARALGMKPEEKKPRYKRALIGAAALGTVGAIGNKIESSMPELQKKIDELMKWGKEKMKPIMEWIDSKIRPMMTAFAEMWAKFKESRFFKTMEELFTSVKSTFMKFFGSELFQSIVSFFKGIAADIGAFFNSDVFQTIISHVKMVGGLLGKVGKLIFTIVKSFYKYVLKPLGWVMGTLYKIVFTALKPLFSALGWVADILTGTINTLDGMFTTIGEFFVGLWKWFKNSWIGKAMGIEDRLDLKQFEENNQIAQEQNTHLKDISDGQGKVVAELQLSNKQQEQIHKRNQEIARQNAQKDLEFRREQTALQKEQVGVNKDVLATVEKVNKNTIEQKNMTQAQIDEAKRKQEEENNDTLLKTIADDTLQIATWADPSTIIGGTFANDDEKVAMRNGKVDELVTSLVDNSKAISDLGLGQKDSKGNYILNFDKKDFNGGFWSDSEYNMFYQALSGGKSAYSGMKMLEGEDGAEYNRYNEDMIRYLGEKAKGDGSQATVARKVLTRIAEYVNTTKGEYDVMNEQQRQERLRQEKEEQAKQQQEMIASLGNNLLKATQEEASKKDDQLFSGMVSSFRQLGMDKFLKMYGKDAYEKIKDRISEDQRVQGAANNIREGVVGAVNVSRDVTEKVVGETNDQLKKIYEYIKSDDFLKGLKGDSDDGSMFVGGGGSFGGSSTGGSWDEDGGSSSSSGSGSSSGGATPSDADGTLGSFVKKFESGKRSSEAIGWDSTGGTSYGKYQIASKTGTMDNFLRFVKDRDPEVYQRLSSAGPANTGNRSGAFVDAWKALAKEGKLKDLEHEFIKKTHYDVSYNGLSKEVRERVDKSRALQEALWSTSVQHGGGGGRNIFNGQFRSGMSDEEFIRAIYAKRRTQFGSSTPAVRAAAQRRFDEEMPLILGIKNPSPNQQDQNTMVAQQGQPTNPQDAVYLGDSIAHGFRNSGNGQGITKVGANPKTVLSQINSYQGDLKGKTVVLSSGLSNNPSDIANIEAQMQALQARGANVKLLGVSSNFKGDESRGAAMNQQLAEIAGKYGAEFQGGFKAGKDTVHPASYKSQPWLSQPPSVQVAQQGQQTGIPKAGIETQDVAVGVGEEPVGNQMIQASQRVSEAQAQAQSKPVVVPVQGGGNSGGSPSVVSQPVDNTREVANVTPQTDESIHFQDDIPARLAQGILSKSFA